MKIYCISLALFLLASSSSSQTIKQENVLLSEAGAMHKKEVIAKTGQFWFALFETLHGFELRRTKVTVKDSSTVGELYDSFVAIDQPAIPLFLTRGSSKFIPGPIQACFYGYQFVEPDQKLCLFFSRTEGFTFYGSGKRNGEFIDDYSLTLFHNSAKQVICSLRIVHLEGAYPTIRWFGDLDRDGKPDLLIDLGRTNGRRLALFLSSAAKQGEFLGQVAVFERIGC